MASQTIVDAISAKRKGKKKKPRRRRTMIICGIDPGLSGAIAVFNTYPVGIEQPLRVYDCPTLAGEMDCKAIITILNGIDPKPTIVGIEKAQAMRKAGVVQGVVSMFSYGKGYGQYLGILSALWLPIQEVPAVTWKREFGLLKQPKDASILKAKNLFPMSEPFLKFKKHHGRSDAILIAEYVRRRLNIQWQGQFKAPNQRTTPQDRTQTAPAEKGTIRFSL